MVDTTGRVPLWIIGTVTSIAVISFIVFSFMVYILDWVHPCNNRIN